MRAQDDFNSLNSYFISLVGIGEKTGRAFPPPHHRRQYTRSLRVHLGNNTEGGQGTGQASSSTAERRWSRELTGDKWINRWSPLDSSLRMTEQKAKHRAWVNDRVRIGLRKRFFRFFSSSRGSSLSFFITTREQHFLASFWWKQSTRWRSDELWKGMLCNWWADGRRHGNYCSMWHCNNGNYQMINTNHWTWMPSWNRVKQCSGLQLFNLLLGCIYSLASINESGH